MISVVHIMYTYTCTSFDFRWVCQYCRRETPKKRFNPKQKAGELGLELMAFVALIWTYGFCNSRFL